MPQKMSDEEFQKLPPAAQQKIIAARARALAWKKKQRTQELIEEAKATVLVEEVDDAKQKEKIKKLLAEGYTVDEIEAFESEEDLAIVFIAAAVQATGTPISLNENRKRHVYFPEDYPANHRMDWWSEHGYPNEVLHMVEPVALDELADQQIFFAETVAKINHYSKQRAAGLVPEGKHLLSPRWFSMAGDVANRRLKAIEDYLTANGITNLWKFGDQEPYEGYRTWQEWTWTPAPTKPLDEPRLRSRTIISPAQALASNPVVRQAQEQRILEKHIENTINPLPLIEQALRERMR
jgi:hypothetical protein